MEYVPTHEIPAAPTTQIKVPVLGVWSALDDYLTEGQLTLSAGLVTDFTYQRLEGAGHWMMLDAPEALNAILLDYLGKFN